MFAPQPELVARELLRVCSPGGTIAMGNWTREGFVGQMFKTFAKFIAPSGMPAPVLWGDEAVVRERLGHGVSDLKMTRRIYDLVRPVRTNTESCECFWSGSVHALPGCGQ
jgi:hypothetical protein